jgi:transketolase
MEEVDRELMATLCTDVLRPAVAEEVIAAARAQFEASRRPDTHAATRAELATVERELSRLAEAIATGDAPVPALMDRWRRAEASRQHLVDRARQS